MCFFGDKRATQCEKCALRAELEKANMQIEEMQEEKDSLRDAIEDLTRQLGGGKLLTVPRNGLEYAEKDDGEFVRVIRSLLDISKEKVMNVMTQKNVVLDQLEKASNEFDSWSESKKQTLGSAIGYYPDESKQLQESSPNLPEEKL